MKQRTFFDTEFDADQLAKRHGIAPSDPNVVAEDVARLGGQNTTVLDRLRKGPATSHELARISLKYTSRISDLRKAGHVITCERTSAGGVYTLEASNG